MPVDVKTFKEIMSLTMSQSLERYNEMRSAEAHAAIAAEWDEQMAILFEVILFSPTRGGIDRKTKLVERNRKDGTGIYLVPAQSYERGPR
jgi:hypothetical protein